MAKDRDYFAFLMQAGAGKTPTTITTIKYKWALNGGVLPTLILSPVIVLDNWRNEFTTWTKLDKRYIGVVKGTAKKRLEIINNPEHKVIVVNYEALRSDAVVKALEAKKFRIAICDESQRIKSYRSISCRKTLQIAKHADVFRSILSGTPITNSVVDIWSQALFLDKGRTFGNRLTVFRSQYMINENAVWQASGSNKAFPAWKMNPARINEFQEKLESISIQVKTDEMVDLPDYQSIRVDVELSPEQRKHYTNVKKELITWLEDQEENPLVTKNALTKILRLNQISSGFLQLYDGQIHNFKSNPRLEACMDLIESCLPDKIIIFCIYKEDYKNLRKALDKKGYKYLQITGEISTQDKLDAAEKFNQLEGDERILIANTRAAGLGINLKGAKFKIYFDRSYSLEDYLQSQRRNYRAGALDLHSKLIDYHLVAPETIDEMIYQKLLDKKKFSEKLLDIKKLLT